MGIRPPFVWPGRMCGSRLHCARRVIPGGLAAVSDNSARSTTSRNLASTGVLVLVGLGGIGSCSVAPFSGHSDWARGNATSALDRHSIPTWPNDYPRKRQSLSVERNCVDRHSQLNCPGRTLCLAVAFLSRSSRLRCLSSRRRFAPSLDGLRDSRDYSIRGPTGVMALFP